MNIFTLILVIFIAFFGHANVLSFVVFLGLYHLGVWGRSNEVHSSYNLQSSSSSSSSSSFQKNMLTRLPSSPSFGHAYAIPFMIFIGCCHIGILFPLCGILMCQERAMKYMKFLQLAIIIIIVFLCKHTHLLSPSIVQVCWHSHFSLAFVILVLILQNHGFYTISIMF